MRTEVLWLMLIWACAPSAWAEQGSRELFNGRDLSGWCGDPRIWRVSKGILVGETKTSSDIKTNTFLVWKKFDVDDFELRAVVRLAGPNSGVQYRSHLDPSGGPYCVAGYQADLHLMPNYLGMLYEERGRGILAERGRKLKIGRNGERTEESSLPRNESIDLNQWNQLEICALGNHLIHKLNGKVTADVVDGDVKRAARRGLLALQVSSGPPIKVEFKSIQLKPLTTRDEISK